MGHSHHHDDGSYYMEQVCTIAISGLLGLVAVLLYTGGRVNLLLAPSLHWTVLAGGIALLVLTAVRGLALAVTMSRRPAVAHEHTHDHDHEHCDHEHHHDHAHDHDHAHGHDHEHCDHHHHHDHEHAHPVMAGAAEPEHSHAHDHDHGHDHGWAPWRYMLLLVPVILFFGLDLPRDGFSVIEKADAAGLAAGGQVADKGDLGELSFTELAGAVNNPDRRDYYEGKTVRLKGQFRGSNNDHIFQLVRFKMACCAADAVPLDAYIMIDPEYKEPIDSAALQGKWVEVTGQVQFRAKERNGQQETVAVIFIRPDKDHPFDKVVRVLPKGEQPSPFL